MGETIKTKAKPVVKLRIAKVAWDAILGKQKTGFPSHQSPPRNAPIRDTPRQ